MIPLSQAPTRKDILSSIGNRTRDPLLENHFATLNTKWGRYRLNLTHSSKFVVWRLVTRAANVTKRAIDMALSAFALVALSPLFLLVAAIIKIEDGGPIFFAQTRVGQYGRNFRMFKFRSMRTDAETRLKDILKQNQHQNGVTFKLKNDPRITRIGRWIRKYSVDELPQILNVLRGEMSLVGPRPPVPREVALYSIADRRRLAVKPGLTCIWQISGRAEIDFPGQVRLDVQYIESQSVWTDLLIILKTIPAILTGSGAY